MWFKKPQPQAQPDPDPIPTEDELTEAANSFLNKARFIDSFKELLTPEEMKSLTFDAREKLLQKIHRYMNS